MAKYTVLEALQKSVYKDGFYWKVKAKGEDGREYDGDLFKTSQPEIGKNFEANLTPTDWGNSFKQVKWEGEVVKKSYIDNRKTYDFTKDEKIENDKKTSERIARQGFANQAMALFPNYKGDVEKWLKDIKQLEPIYRLYIEKGEL